jgi:hypothetical protein
MLYTMGYNAPEHRILPKDYDWKDRKTLDSALKEVAPRAAPMDDRFPRRSERRDRQRRRLS